MAHSIRPLPFKPSRLVGLLERLLASHYENTYGGAVRRLNAVEAQPATPDWDRAPVFESNGLKREQRIAANSMLLHEACFETLGSTGEPAGTPAAALEHDIGSLAAWQRAVATTPATAEPAADEISAEALRDMLDRRDQVLNLDVRLEEDLAKSGDRLPDASAGRPQDVAARAADLPKDRPVVACCVYGFQVSRDAATALRRHRVDCRALAGGIAAWHAIGAPTIAKL